MQFFVFTAHAQLAGIVDRTSLPALTPPLTMLAHTSCCCFLGWNLQNIVRVNRDLCMVDLDMSFSAASVEHTPPPHTDKAKLSGSTAYAAPELMAWMKLQDELGWSKAAQTSPLDKLPTPFAVDLWGLGATMYEMATSVPLFTHS